jgi:hypothetical protein
VEVEATKALNKVKQALRDRNADKDESRPRKRRRVTRGNLVPQDEAKMENPALLLGQQRFSETASLHPLFQLQQHQQLQYQSGIGNLLLRPTDILPTTGTVGTNATGVAMIPALTDYQRNLPGQQQQQDPLFAALQLSQGTQFASRTGNDNATRGFAQPYWPPTTATTATSRTAAAASTVLTSPLELPTVSENPFPLARGIHARHYYPLIDPIMGSVSQIPSYNRAQVHNHEGRGGELIFPGQFSVVDDASLLRLANRNAQTMIQTAGTLDTSGSSLYSNQDVQRLLEEQIRVRQNEEILRLLARMGRDRST